MSNLTRFDPFAELARFEPFQGLDDWFRESGIRPSLRDVRLEPRIRIDVAETDEAYTVKAEIPGVQKEDIKVDVDGSEVSIAAELKKESEDKQGKTLRMERCYGRQVRTFTLGKEIDQSRVVARYENGVLNLLLPKRTGGGGTRIAVG